MLAWVVNGSVSMLLVSRMTPYLVKLPPSFFFDTVSLAKKNSPKYDTHCVVDGSNDPTASIILIAFVIIVNCSDLNSATQQ